MAPLRWSASIALAAVVPLAPTARIGPGRWARGHRAPELMLERNAVNGTAAYVCERFACQRPVTEPDELAAALG